MPAPTTKHKRTKSAPRKGRRTGGPVTHVVIDDEPVSGGGRRARRGASKAKAEAAASRIRKTGKDYVSLPSWKELEKANGRVVTQKSHPFDSISTARIALMILVGAVTVTAYVGHVHATQAVLDELDQLRIERAALRLEYNSVKGDYDRLTGPAEIRRLAREQGMVETTSYGARIRVDG